MKLRARVLTPVSPTEVRWLPDATVTLDGERIAAVEPGGPADEDLRPATLVPGFVDAHVHYPQTRIVGSATGPLLDWLQHSAWPEEALFADPVHAETVAERFCDALAAAGTTLAFAYSSVHPAACEILLRALDHRGLRAIAGPVLMDVDCPDALKLPHDVALPALEALAERWAGHPRLRVAAIPRFALSCSPAMLRGAGDLARRLGLWTSTHLSENREECRIATERFGTGDYLRVYEDAGLVHERCVLAHCIHLSDAEWDRFAGVVAHCPDSNAFLGSGHMSVGAVLDRGIPLAVGTDVAAGRTFRVPRILSAAFDNALATGLRLPPERLWWMGTRGGALALGHDGGAVEPGLAADLVLLDLPEDAEASGALAHALFADVAVLRTWVAGRRVF